MIRTIGIVTLAFLLAAGSLVVAQENEPEASPPPGVPPHGDHFPLRPDPLGFAVSPIPSIAVPVARERIDGQDPVMGYVVLMGTPTTTLAQVLENAGFTVLDVRDIGSIPEEAVKDLPTDTELDGFLALTHPTPPITDGTGVPITMYHDDAMEAVTDWQTISHDAFTIAHNAFWDYVNNLYIYRYIVMTSGTPVYDVATWCEWQQTADYEKQFTHRGAIVHLYSPGWIEGNGGAADKRPISAQIAGQWVDNGVKKWWDSCNNVWSTTLRLPATYVAYPGSGYLAWMGRSTAHELGHVFNLEHSDGDCWGSTGHWHVSIMAGVGNSLDFEPDCRTQDAINNPHDHTEFRTTERNKAWTERQRWTTCYNNGAC